MMIQLDPEGSLLFVHPHQIAIVHTGLGKMELLRNIEEL